MNSDERIKIIEQKVNNIDISLKNANSMKNIAKNALINYIIMYILMAIIIIFHITALAKKTCSKINKEKPINQKNNNKVFF